MTVIINTENNLILYSADSNIKDVMLFIKNIPEWEKYDIVETQIEIAKPSQSTKTEELLIPGYQNGEA
jgi:hypothetical protein